MTELHWIILAADTLLTLAATMNSLALGRIGRMAAAKRPKEATYPPVSVIITAHNQEEELRKHLPALLLQDYPAPFEVVVVDMASTDNTAAILEHMEEQYPMLRHTFTPPTARDISLERLALTLGIRSATYNWTMLLQAGCCPIGPHWLKRMGEIMINPNTNMVIGPVYPISNANSYTILWKELQWLSYAAKHGAYCSGQCNVAYQKDFFMSHQGFASHAQLAGGAIDIMVNRHSTPTNTKINIRPESVMLYKPVTNSDDSNLLYMETRRHLTRHHLYRIQYAIVAAAFPTAFFSAFLTMLWMGWHQEWWMVATAATFFLLHWTTYHRTFTRSVYKLGLHSPRPWEHIQALVIPLTDLRAWIRHKLTNQNVFRKKFI